MRKKLPILLLTIVFLLQAFIPAIYAASKNEVAASSASFCPFDTTSEGTGKAAGQGFDTFSALKKHLGSPGQGKEWHHIVEQSQIKKSGFPSTNVNNADNVIAIEAEINRKIGGYYSSKPDFAGGKTVRDWLAGQSYEEQYNFGMNVLRRFGVLE